MRALLCLSALLLGSCGYVGDPLPPALNIPVAPEDFQAIQLGDRIVLQFRQSLLTTEGLALEKLGSPQVEAAGEVFEVTGAQAGAVRFELPASKWIGKAVGVRVRANSGKGRYSDWSPAITMNIVPPLAAPKQVSAQSTAEGVTIRWEDAAAGQKWVVTRSSKGGEVRLNVETVPFTDREALLGGEYTYRVQARLGTALSPPSEPVTHVHVDRAAPEAPARLSAARDENAVELTWAPSASPDATGYRIYRRSGDAPWGVLADAVNLPVYTDRTAEAGRSYEYAVSALDRSGNESLKSNTATVN